MGAESSEGARNANDVARLPRRRHPVDLDDVDRELCRLLADDPTLSRRELGGLVGLTDETISARLRSLRERNVIATTVAVDWENAGYEAGAILRCSLRGRALARSISPALESSRVVYVAAATGCCDLVIALLDTDLASLRARIAELRVAMRDIDVIGTDLVVDVALYNTLTHTLPVDPWSADELPSPSVTLDDVDRRLIGMLAVAGDESLRSIARQLGVSDATVRSRLRRLEDAKLLRIVTARDPIAFGDLRAHALAFLTMDSPDSIAALTALPTIQSVYVTVGGSDAVLALAATDEQALSRALTRDLRQVDGVRQVEVAHIFSVLRHRTHLVRLVDLSGEGAKTA